MNGHSCDSLQTSITPEEFRLLAKDSCTIYYKYLQEKEKTEDPFAGCKVVHIRSISPLEIPNEYILCIAEKIKPRDGWRVFIKERPCKDITILAVRQLSQFSYGVRIRDDSPSPPGFDPLKPEDTKLVFDLKFLIQNLGTFYSTNLLDFSPQSPDRIDPLPSFLTQNLSSEQAQAIETVFSSPVSYINGAPGTGKTRAVLANCILRYVLAKQRVILLAPTNNAVEQIFTVSTRDRLQELEEQKARLTSQLDSARATADDIISEEEIAAVLRHYATGDIHDKRYQETLIDAFLICAYVYPDHYRLYFTTTPSTPIDFPLSSSSYKDPTLRPFRSRQSSAPDFFFPRKLEKSPLDRHIQIC